MNRKTLCIFGLCLCFFSLSVLWAQSASVPEADKKSAAQSLLNPWFSELNIAIASGVSYTHIGEFVYKKSGGGFVPLSRLDWSNLLLWTADAHINYDIKRFRMLFDFTAAMPVFHTAHMQDKDWKQLNGTLTDFSEHPVRLDSHFGTQTGFVYRIWDLNTFSAGMGAAFAYKSTELTARDGIKHLPAPQLKLSGDLISYRQELYLPELVLFSEWKPHPVFEALLMLYVSPIGFAQTLDTHFDYNRASGSSKKPDIHKQFSDRMYGFGGVNGDIVLRLTLPQKTIRARGTDTKTKEVSDSSAQRRKTAHALELRLNAAFVPELQGKTYQRRGSVTAPFFPDEDGKPGSSFRSFGASLAYCIRIR